MGEGKAIVGTYGVNGFPFLNPVRMCSRKSSGSGDSRDGEPVVASSHGTQD